MMRIGIEIRKLIKLDNAPHDVSIQAQKHSTSMRTIPT